MWPLPLFLLCLPPPGSGTPLRAPHSLALSENASNPGPQSPGASRMVTPSLPPATSSDAPALSLNLGLNFKIKVRSQGKSRPGEGSGVTTPRTGPPPTRAAAAGHPKAPAGGFWPEAPGGSGAAEDPPSLGPGMWPWESILGSGPTARAPLALWPKLVEKGLDAEDDDDEDEDGRDKELEFKIDIDLTAGVGKEGGPNGSSNGGTGRRYPLLPGLSVGISEIASKLGAPGFFGATLPPQMWEPPEWNGTGGTKDSPQTPGPESSSLAASPGGEGAFAALPGCLPDHPEDCGSPLPEPVPPALSSLLPPAVPLFVPLHADWNSAQAEWGLAWEAHIYGAGSLFALLALLSLLGLLALPCRCPVSCKLLTLLHLLLASAGGARALLLFGDAWGQLELLPDFAVRLLHDLALPCLTSALAVAFLLLALRSRAKGSTRAAGLQHPCLLALLVLLHFSVATGAALAADLLNQLPFLLLASRGLFALLSALLSSSLLVFYCLARVDTAGQVYDLKTTATPTCHCPFGDARRWRRAARAALSAACFGLLSASLHTYALLHALGYGLSPELFGPWPWWALQLACRLCEAGMGLPLACLGLCPLFCPPSESWCQCCGGLLSLTPEHSRASTAKSQLLPNNFQWALSQHSEKLVICDTIARSESDYLPLYAIPEAEVWPATDGATPDASDPTADFRPPSPIDLRRSIDEALCSEGLFQEGGPLYTPSTFSSLSLAREPSVGSSLSRAASCVELVPVPSQAADEGEASLETSVPNTTLSSPGPWRAGSAPTTTTSSSTNSSATCSPCKCSTEDSSLALCTSPGQSSASGVPTLSESPLRSPPPPGRQYWVLTPVSQESLASVGQPGADTALLQKEFMDVCRQIDTLSVSSETIDL